MALFTRDELIIIRVVFYELFDEHPLWSLYPVELGMSVTEFTTENRRALVVMLKNIKKRFGIAITNEHKGEFYTAVRAFLDKINRVDPTPGRGRDLGDRQEQIIQFKKKLLPFERHAWEDRKGNS